MQAYEALYTNLKILIRVRLCVIHKQIVIFETSQSSPFLDNDSEEEAPPKTQTQKRAAELACEPEEDAEETGDGEADDEEGSGEEGDDDDVEGVNSGSEREGGQNQSASMSSRSESKLYSSVTHKCEVRNVRVQEGRGSFS